MIARRRVLSLLTAAPAIACSSAKRDVDTSIDWQGFISAGGVEQWVAIRGRDRSRTAVLFLHGGPCEAQSPFLSVFAPWEERYVVAQWDQRGSGRSFESAGASTPNMTLEQIAEDCLEIAHYILGRLGLPKLVLVGHSWGAILGLRAIRARPELFHAFVATGLPVDGGEIIENMRLSAVARATAAGDAQAVAALNGLTAPDLADMTKLGVVFRWAEPFPASDASYLATQSALLGSPGDLATAAAWRSARSVCLPQLMPFVFGFDAGEAGYDLPVPFFVIQGSGDTRTLPEAARAFLHQVRAPAKGYTAVEGGHFACFTNPTGFLNALDRDLRRLRIG